MPPRNLADETANDDGVKVVSIFGPPDRSILTAGRRPAVPMKGEIFGPAWEMMQSFSEGAGCPPDYPAMAFLAACASLIGAKRRARPFEGVDWSEPCIIWAAAVGDPSCGKSPGLEAITGPLKVLEKQYAEDHKDTLRIWQADVERSKQEKDNWQSLVKTAAKDGLTTPALPIDAIEPDKPQRRRMMVTDATPEAVAEILSGNPVGTMHYRDELAGWISSFDRYSPGGRSFWLEANGGRSFVIDRKGNAEPLTLEFNGVTVLGGIQPEKLADALLTSVDDGLVSRFLWAFPDPIPYTRPKNSGDTGKLRLIYSRLDALSWAQGEHGEAVARHIPLAADAADLFDDWIKDNDAGLLDAGSLYKNFCGKLRGMALRIALVSEHIKWAWDGGAEPDAISMETIGSACDFLDLYAKPMAQRVFGDAALPQVERNAAVLGRYIIKNNLASINARELKRTAPNYNGPKQAAPLNEAIELLVECNWLRSDAKREGGTQGRASADYTVNPAVMGV